MTSCHLELTPALLVTITQDAGGSYWSEYVIRLPEGNLTGGTGRPAGSALDALAQLLDQLRRMAVDPTLAGSQTAKVMAGLCGWHD